MERWCCRGFAAGLVTFCRADPEMAVKVHRSSGNVFRDVGFGPEEAARARLLAVQRKSPFAAVEYPSGPSFRHLTEDRP